MKTINIEKNNTKKLKPCAIALGFFDGLHIGHQKIVKETIKEAKKNNIKSALFTFSHSPKDLIAGSESPTNISGLSESKAILEKMGLDYLIVFNIAGEDLKAISAKTFVNKYLKTLGVQIVVCGKDFMFGKNRIGKAENITKLSNGKIQTKILKFVKRSGAKVSSRLIKQLLRENKLSKVQRLLGRNFNVVGVVKHGKKLGRVMGHKTANIDIKDELSMELCGVFAVEVEYKNKIYKGVANVGYAPTFQNFKEKKLEVFLFKFNKEIYNKQINVRFIKFIREEVKFESPLELIIQIKKDINKAREYFKK